MSTLSIPLGADFYPATNRDDLPAYTPPKEEHLSSKFLNHKGVPWLTLNIKSQHIATSSSQTLPLYKKPGPVSGDIVLMLDKPEAIQAVKISLRGTSSFASGETSTSADSPHTLAHTYTFLELTETLWSSLEGTGPRFAEPPPWGFPRNGKLQGKYTFPFTLHLPHEFTSETPRPKDAPATYRMPASFYNKKSPAAIDYDVCVILVRSALKANTSLSMTFYYTPRTRPDPPSELRQLAYSDGFPAPDPLGDAVGWYTIYPPLNIRGKLANGQTVEVVCTFALARPLTYSRGSFIPLNLAIQCSDPEALELLQSPLAVSIILLQSISTGKHAHVEKPRISREIHVYPIARAVCWQSTSTGPWNDSRMLMGEIALPKKIPPSTISPRVVIKYSVVMLPFDIVGFTAADPHSFVVDQQVDIVTHIADGPPPRSQIPPGYNDPRKDLTDRFDQMMKTVAMFA